MAINREYRFRLGVVIVNYNTPGLVESALKSLTPMLAPADAGVVVVDNASTDGSFERLSAFCDGLDGAGRVQVIAAQENRGFSAGNNLGAQSISSDFVLFMNSDAVAEMGALDALLASAADHPHAGLVSPKILSSAGEVQVSRFRNLSPLSEFVDGAQTGPVTKIFQHAEIPIFPDDTKTQPAWVSFAAVLVSRAAMEKAGPMDEGFFLYFEDCDYCRRVASAGYDIAYALNAVFRHDAGGSTQLRRREDQGARLPAYYYASRARYFRKYYGPFGPAAANLAWYLGRGIAKLRGVVGRPAPPVSEGRARDIWINWRGKHRNM